MRAAVAVVIRLAADHRQRPPRDHHRDLIVVGASAGGVEALRDLIGGLPAGLTCPECKGSLLALEPGQDRFRCRAGHAWTADALLATAADRMQTALWTALRTLEEKATLAAQMSVSARNRGSERLARTYERTAAETSHAAGVLRERLTTGDVEHRRPGG